MRSIFLSIKSLINSSVLSIALLTFSPITLLIFEPVNLVISSSIILALDPKNDLKSSCFMDSLCFIRCVLRVSSKSEFSSLNFSKYLLGFLLEISLLSSAGRKQKFGREWTSAKLNFFCTKDFGKIGGIQPKNPF